MAPKILHENSTEWPFTSPAPENVFRQLVYRVLRKCYLETRDSRDEGFSQFSLHSEPWRAVQNTMLMPQ